MDDLCQTYGYASDGESFSIADQNEVWLMELIGKGKEKGAVWVARRVPEGTIPPLSFMRTRGYAHLSLVATQYYSILSKHFSILLDNLFSIFLTV